MNKKVIIHQPLFFDKYVIEGKLSQKFSSYKQLQAAFGKYQADINDEFNLQLTPKDLYNFKKNKKSKATCQLSCPKNLKASKKFVKR